MRTHWLALLLVAGCEPGDPLPVASETLTSYTVPIAVIPKRAIDVLFMVDNSNSMDALRSTNRAIRPACRCSSTRA